MLNRMERRRNNWHTAPVEQHFTTLDAVIRAVGDQTVPRQISGRYVVQPLAVGHPRRFLAVFFCIPLAGPTETQAGGVDYRRHICANRRSAHQLFPALFDMDAKPRKPIAQMAEARHRDVQTSGLPVVLHASADLSHAPAEHPIERVNQFNAGSVIFWRAIRNADCSGGRIDELTLQLASEKIQTDFSALFQTQVVPGPARQPVVRLLTLALRPFLQTDYI